MVASANRAPIPFHPRTEKDKGTPKRPSKRLEYATLVFMHIPAGNNAAPISGKDLADLSGLTLMQVAKGIEAIRDDYPEFPLVSSPQGYLFTIDAGAVAKYRSARAKSAHTTIRRLWTGTIKPYISQPGFNSREARRTSKEFERVIEDLADILS
jgi:hypothetical protein